MELNLRDLKKNIGDCQNLVGDCKGMIGDCKEMMRDMTMMLGEMLATKTRNKSSAPFSVSTASSSSSSSLSPTVSSGIGMAPSLSNSSSLLGAYSTISSSTSNFISTQESDIHIKMSDCESIVGNQKDDEDNKDGYKKLMVKNQSKEDALMWVVTPRNEDHFIGSAESRREENTLFTPIFEGTDEIIINDTCEGPYDDGEGISLYIKALPPDHNTDDGVIKFNNDTNMELAQANDDTMTFENSMQTKEDSFQNGAQEMNIIMLNPEQIQWFHDKIPSLSSVEGSILFEYQGIIAEHIEYQLIQRDFKVCDSYGNHKQDDKANSLQIFCNQYPSYGEWKQFSGKVEIMTILMNINIYMLVKAPGFSFEDDSLRDSIIWSPHIFSSHIQAYHVGSCFSSPFGRNNKVVSEDKRSSGVDGLVNFSSSSLFLKVAESFHCPVDRPCLDEEEAFAYKRLLELLLQQIQPGKICTQIGVCRFDHGAQSISVSIENIVENTFGEKYDDKRRNDQGMQNVIEKFIIFVWGWYYKDFEDFYVERIKDLKMTLIHCPQLEVHPGYGIMEWMIAWRWKRFLCWVKGALVYGMRQLEFAWRNYFISIHIPKFDFKLLLTVKRVNSVYSRIHTSIQNSCVTDHTTVSVAFTSSTLHSILKVIAELYNKSLASVKAIIFISRLVGVSRNSTKKGISSPDFFNLLEDDQLKQKASEEKNLDSVLGEMCATDYLRKEYMDVDSSFAQVKLDKPETYKLLDVIQSLLVQIGPLSLVEIGTTNSDKEGWHCVQTSGERYNGHSPTLWALSFKSGRIRMFISLDDLTQMVNDKHMCHEAYKIIEKIIFIIWSWFYKDFVETRELAHPSNWIIEWKIAWM